VKDGAVQEAADRAAPLGDCEVFGEQDGVEPTEVARQGRTALPSMRAVRARQIHPVGRSSFRRERGPE
jgi:hypothetical protein